MATKDRDQILSVIAEHANRQVLAQDSVESLGLDSLELLDLMVELDIPDTDISRMVTVGDLLDYVSPRTLG